MTSVQLNWHIQFVCRSYGCEIMHYFKSLTGGGIYGNVSAIGDVGALIYDVFVVNIDGHRTWGRLTRWRYLIFFLC